MTDAEIVAACEARGCCPLGAVDELGVPQPCPGPRQSIRRFGVADEIACSVVDAWDMGDRMRSVRIATAAGLRPRIEAFLSGGGKP